MEESYGKDGKDSLRQRVFALLDENPLLTAKILCEKLGLPYVDKANHVTKLRSEWKSYRQNERGSKCSEVHGWRGWCYVPYYVNRDLALQSGWVLSKARNRGLLWKDNFGRMEWFENGRVNLHVRKPVNLGKVKQLISNGFSKTNLIEDFELLEQVMKTIHFKEAHYVFNTGHTLPKGTIDFFAEKSGFIIKVGDSSHPKAVEVISRVPDWVERLEETIERIGSLLSQNAYDPNCAKKPDYVV